MNDVAEPIKKKTTKEFGLKEVLKNLKNLKVLLKDVLKKKKEIEKSFSNKFKELEKQTAENQKWFDKEWQRLEKLEVQLILWWDFWKREVEINRLRDQTGIGTLPSERKKINEQIESLDAYNEKLEKSFKEGKIDTEIVAELRKVLEKELEEEEERKKQG